MDGEPAEAAGVETALACHACGGVGAYGLNRRTQKYRAMAAVHARATELRRSRVDPMCFTRSAAWQARAKYHAEMALKYERGVATVEVSSTRSA